MALSVKVKTKLDSEEKVEGYLAIDNVAFIRGTGQMGSTAPGAQKFSILVFYTIYPNQNKESIIYKGRHVIPWTDSEDTANAFSYAYSKLKSIDTLSESTDI